MERRGFVSIGVDCITAAKSLWIHLRTEIEGMVVQLMCDAPAAQVVVAQIHSSSSMFGSSHSCFEFRHIHFTVNYDDDDFSVVVFVDGWILWRQSLVV